MGRGRKGYFYEKEEQAVINYIKTDDAKEKSRIFNEILFPAFTKMTESIIRRYKLYVPDEEFNQTFEDTISYLMTKISYYKEIKYEYEEIEFLPENVSAEYIEDEKKKRFFKNADKNSPKYIIVENLDDVKPYELKMKRYKAFSYCQTIIRNYLQAKCIQYVKQQQRNIPYESDVFENKYRYSMDEINDYALAENLIKKTYEKIVKMVESPEEYNLSENEINVGYALIELLRDNNWEKLIKDDGSNKLQKNRILFFLREESRLSTKIMRDNMKVFKKLYYELKGKEIE